VGFRGETWQEPVGEAKPDGGCVWRKRCQEAIIMTATATDPLAVGGECYARDDHKIDLGWVYFTRRIGWWLE
jgi:hypothetical protein